MNLDHDVQNSSKKENYINGSLDDFTDCIDFTKQYQKSCGLVEGNIDGYSDVQSLSCDNKYNSISDSSVEVDQNHVKNSDSCEEKTFSNESQNFEDSKVTEKNETEIENEGEHHPMEPDVSITIGESNLEKTINHVAKGFSTEKNNEEPLNVANSENVKKQVNKLSKRNHLKLPVNKNIKKKVSLFKFKNGKQVKKRKETFNYQGIQSNIKFKCYKCLYSDFLSISELQNHQRKCISGAPDFQSVHESSFSNPTTSSNFKITRKVYLCSACGSYYENWNLFLHMKEIHKRHICLYCLGMFSQPDKLAQHLQTKHNVIEQNLSSSEDFLKLFRGTCYLICVSCETMFSEQENFYEHSCASSQAEDTSPCTLCGLRGSHYPTCRRAFSDRSMELDLQKPHAASGRKVTNKKKKLKANKKNKELFQVVNNENNGEMSVIVRKQSLNDGLVTSNDFKAKENLSEYKDSNDLSITSPSHISNEDLVSAKQYNEKLLQLYRPSKITEKVTSSIQSIEDSINRVVENSRIVDETDIKSDEEIEGGVSSVLKEENTSYIKESFGTLINVNAQNSVCDDFENVTKADQSKFPDNENQDQSLGISESKNCNDTKTILKVSENRMTSDSESTDSEKLTIAFDQPEQSSGKPECVSSNMHSSNLKSEDNIPTAPKDTSYIFVSVNEETDNVKDLIKEFVKVSSWNCVYCSHAKRIALNGKQLALHIIAEHRFVTVPEDSTEEEKEESALKTLNKLKSSLSSLQNCYFNTDTFDSEDKLFWKPNDRIYECFHCLFATYMHKELCSHNRKMHQKAVFLCIMCKSNFYTYSELLCHLCPGIYISGQVINPDITYRCFLCSVDPLPSSFRLMVHLRRKHNSCDICFDQSSNQFQLSTHVWKHKLSHMCYRCGIAYRNKPDITKHLFWKHGTESVLCKKCLQKKWPHVYHFCVPPNSFICDECSVSLKSAIALKVHKRLHSGDYPYSCNKCEEKFISRKLLGKHLEKHEEEEKKALASETPEIEPEKENEPMENVKPVDVETNIVQESDKKPEKEKKSKKRKVLNDVFDLPPVNLSESDDSDVEAEVKPSSINSESLPEETPTSNGFLNGDIQKEEVSPTQIVDGVWNNFQNYLVAKDMPKTFRPASPFKSMTLSRIKEIMLSDHDYHLGPVIPNQDSNSSKPETEKTVETSKKVGLDHDYCNNVQKTKISCKSKQKVKHREDASKSSSSDSSSDSDSSCSCGSNCSCSTGSSSSTSSNDSDSDSPEKRKHKRNDEEKEKSRIENEAPTEVDVSVHDVSNENLIKESDLETDETETDEDFYDFNPAREANRILAEKRTQLLANLNGTDTVTLSPSVNTDSQEKNIKKKAKFKKKRSLARSSNASKGSKKKNLTNIIPSFTKNQPQSVIESNGGDSNLTLFETPSNRLRMEDSLLSSVEGDSKRPKRKRVPLKFYGFSSDEENEVTPGSKKREKSEHVTSPASFQPTVSSVEPHTDDGLPVWNSHGKSSLTWRVEKTHASTPKVNPIKIRTSQANKESPCVENASDSDSLQFKRTDRNLQVNGNVVAQKGEKLYCFCQCPYDEVSEMIACDAEDCAIEWFHFECVGIMVPPKGSWYCPDCRKKLAAENEFLPDTLNEQSLN